MPGSRRRSRGSSHRRALAVARDGSLLIVDAWRDQVLRRRRDGRLELFAGTGEVGFGGDGGAAVDARLSGPSALAVARDGTVCVADTGNGRIRAVAPDGRIRSLPGRFDRPAGLALAPDGSLFVATTSAVVRVGADGRRSVFVAGHGRFAQLVVGGSRYGAFGPSYLALDKAGDLYAFSSGTKTVFELSRGGARCGRGRSTPTGSRATRGRASGSPSLPTASPSRPTGRSSSTRSSATARPTGPRSAAARIDAPPLRDGLLRSDRARWAGLATDAVDGHYDPGRHRVTAAGPARDDPYAAAVARACGRALLDESLAVTVGPGVYSDQVGHLSFLDRGGRPLIYRQHV